MPAELLHPGVYVQEVASGVRPIQGVSTSTAAFIGVTDKGPLPGAFLPTGRPAQPVLITSFTDYQRQFGGFRSDSFLTYAVKAFYDNGGQRVYIVRVANGATAATFGPGSPPLSPPGGTLPISAANEGAWGNNIWISVTGSSDRNPANFKLVVMTGATAKEASRNIVESYDNVTVASAAPGAPLPPNYIGALVNGRSEFIAIPPDSLITTAPTPFAPRRLTGGLDGAAVTAAGFTGDVSVDGVRTGTGLHALDKITDVNLIAIPGQGDVTTVNAGIDYCKDFRQLQDCFFIADVGSVTSVPAARLDNAVTDVLRVSDAHDFATIGDPPGTQIDQSAGDFGAIYYPWVVTTDPIGTGNNPRILVPPSGFVAGIYARTDNSRGVFKAPAGIDTGLAGAISPATTVSDAEQDSLNPVSVNVIRSVPGSGLVIWGARTIGSDAEYRYIPVRRMAIFLRVSIYFGIQFAVFEPNDEPLWSSLRLNIRAFMLTQFRAGAFQGAKPDDAFFVKCDSTTTTQTDIDNGVVNILVGFAPLKPAEFVVLQLTQIVNQQPQ
jgi:uncharacterized protein